MSPTVTGAPVLLGPPPPLVRRDRMVVIWVLAVTVSWFGDAMWTVALAWTAAHTLSPAMAGAVIGLETLPAAALVLVGGVLADRFDTRRVLVFGQLAQALVMVVGAIAWTAGYQGATTLVVLAVSFGVSVGLTLPAGMTLVRQLVREEDLGTVSGWNNVAVRVARLLGAPAGGLLVAWRGPAAPMLLNAVTFLTIAATLALVVRPRYRIPRTPAPVLASLSDGLGYLRSTPAARLLVIGLTGLNVFVTPAVALGVALGVSRSGWGSTWLGLAEGALAAGAIVGSLLAIRHRPPRPAQRSFGVLLVQAVAIVGIGIGDRGVLVTSMAVIGLTSGLASVWLSATFQRTVASTHLGRVSSVLLLGDRTLVPLALPVFGALAAGASLVTATAVFGAGMFVLCLTLATRPSVARLR
ncbi:MFS transporter [Nocardioides guangzhouensis]|uniref:MFS transporter n=1 Tax=Nocardioides guangzhouensis TaxID=2497878 RepID=A0A4Q4Z9M6_9ACTN|nr:MFS transporter [Nocardioides guangzhouensis]RYP83911.1 MFS transporter [Nocardioides guangzhouensis]